MGSSGKARISEESWRHDSGSKIETNSKFIFGIKLKEGPEDQELPI